MVGDILRREREKQGLTIADVAKETSIRGTYLEALEKGEYDVLPGDVYAKGFIRNYSKFLNIDGDSLLQQYNSERNIEVKVQPVDKAGEPQADRGRQAKVRELAPKERSNSGYQPPQGKKKLFASGDDYRNRTEEKSGSKKFMILLAVMVVFLGGVYIAFMDEGSDPKAVKPAPVKQTQVQKEPEKPVKVYDGVEIVAKFKENCWISVKADGQVIFEGMAEKGKEETWNAKENMEITAGNAGGVELTWNGQNQGLMGEVGQIAERTFTKAADPKAAAAAASTNTADTAAESADKGRSYQESSYHTPAQPEYEEAAPAEPAPEQPAEPAPAASAAPAAPAPVPAEAGAEAAGK